jgi:hypothetical protein
MARGYKRWGVGPEALLLSGGVLRTPEGESGEPGKKSEAHGCRAPHFAAPEPDSAPFPAGDRDMLA